MCSGTEKDIVSHRSLKIGLMASAVFLLAAQMASAQQGPRLPPPPQQRSIGGTNVVVAPIPRSGVPAWFGLKLPPPLDTNSQQFISTLDSDTDLPAQPVNFGPGKRDPNFNGGRLKQDIEKIVSFSYETRGKDYLWGRITGRPAYDHIADWTLGQLKASLPDAHKEFYTAPPIDLPLNGSELRLVGNEEFGAGSKDIVLETNMLGSLGANGTVTAPLVYVDRANEADLAGRDIKGKIAVANLVPDPGMGGGYDGIPPEDDHSPNLGVMQFLMSRGAAGVITIVQQPGNTKSIPPRHGCGTGLCFSVGGKDGYFLMNALGEASRAGKTINATLTARSETLRDAQIANVVATIPGRTDRTIVINAHMDAWFSGADDNATGLSTLLALARYYADGKHKPERTIVLLAGSGHHTSANGVAGFRLFHANDYVAKADLVINLEHIAAVGTVRSESVPNIDNFRQALLATTTDQPLEVSLTNRAPYIIDLYRQGAKCFGLSMQRIVETVNVGDIGRFSDLKDDIPQTQLMSMGEIYHTEAETPEVIPAPAIERAARFWAYFVDQVANAPGDVLHGAPAAPKASCPVIP